MRNAAILFFTLFCFSSLSNAQCRGYRNYVSASFNGNILNKSLGMSEASNASGFEFSYGKAIGWGYNHGLKISSSKYQFANNGLNAMSDFTIGYELGQKIIEIGSLNLKLFADAGMGFRKTSIQNGDFSNNKSTFFDSNLGAEVGFKPICFIELYGRTSMGYQFSKASQGANFRPLNSVGLRYFL
ncbi:MAG: hypothetical protein JXQ87_14985 [Bacteroidia bacterium]